MPGEEAAASADRFLASRRLPERKPERSRLYTTRLRRPRPNGAQIAQARTPAITSKTTSARVRSTFLFRGRDAGSAGDRPLSAWFTVLSGLSFPVTALLSFFASELVT